MKWNIVADSSCDIMEIPGLAEDAGFSTIPFVITVGKTDYIDDENLDTAVMLADMSRTATASHTACPSPGAWYEQFMRADCSIAITISSALSGSYNSACVAKEMVLETNPEKKIHILDSRSTGPEPVMIVEKINEWVKQGLSFEKLVAAAEDLADKTHVLFALSSFENLVKNGRMSRITGFIAGKLGMRVIGMASDEGKIAIRHKTRGASKALALLVEEMRAIGFAGGRVIISHCQNLVMASALGEKIKDAWNTAEVVIMTTRGLCSYYAELNGLIIAF